MLISTMHARLLSRRGTVFDAAIFLANFLLAWPLAGLVRLTRGEDAAFGACLLAAVFLHAAGAHLKRRPLHARLAALNAPPMGGGGYMLFLTLVVMHYAVFVMGMKAGLAGLNLAEIFGPAEPFIVLGCALLPTVLAVAALVPPREPEQPAPALAKREALGDLFLFLSTLVILAWWDGFWTDYLSSAERPNAAYGILLALLATVPFAMFYLAPRMVLLREDYNCSRTWFNAVIVMLPLAIRLAFPRQFF